MQLLAGLILLGLLILLFMAALYFARGQNPRSQRYGSWSQVLPPQGRNHEVLDVAERLNSEISHHRRVSRRTGRRRH